MKNLKNMKGITLIALVVTIIILLILAGVSINFIFGNEGIFSKTQSAVERYQNAQEEESVILGKYEEKIDSARETITISEEDLSKLIDKKTKGTTLYENKAGFADSGNFNISEDIDSYSSFIIQYGADQGVGNEGYKYMQIYGNNQTILLDISYNGINGSTRYIRTLTRKLVIPQTGKTFSLSDGYNTQFVGTSCEIYQDNEIRIYKIIGIK